MLTDTVGSPADIWAALLSVKQSKSVWHTAEPVRHRTSTSPARTSITAISIAVYYSLTELVIVNSVSASNETYDYVAIY